MIFKLGAMHYHMVERSMAAFGEAVVLRISHLLDRSVVIRLLQPFQFVDPSKNSIDPLSNEFVV